MDDIKPKNPKQAQPARYPPRHSLSLSHHNNKFSSGESDNIQATRSYKIVQTVGGAAVWKAIQPKGSARSYFKRYLPHTRRQRIWAGVLLVFFIVGTVLVEVQPFMSTKSTELSTAARALLPKTNQKFADLLQYNAQKDSYEYNASYSGKTTPGVGAESSGTPRINASFSADPSKGVTVTDPVNSISFTVKPKFKLEQAKQDQNQVLYRLSKGNGHLVYTAQSDGVKEDIVLSSSNKDKMVFEYDLGLDNGLEPRLEKNGSLGVYGTSLPLNGDVSTGSDKDKQLLDKARQSAAKDKLLFTIPAPVVKESNKTKSDVASHFELSGSTLRVVTEKLKNASYPLTIDPSIFVKSAAKLMRGNNETNIDFDVANNQILKGSLTGARIPDWTTNSSNPLPSKIWNAGSVAEGGFVYAVGGNNGTSNLSSVYWAKFDTSTNAIGAWTTGSGYNLPAARSGMSVVAYDGYLFAMGGQDASCTVGNGTGTNGVCKTAYSIKLGANGEPVSWTTIGNLSTERRYTGVAAYENRMYLFGGQTGASTANGGVATSEYAEINPNGTLGTWTTTGAGSQLTSARYGLSANTYNGYVYVVGGNTNSTTPVTTVQYAKIISTGLSSWVTTTAFNSVSASGRQTFGGNISTLWGGYLYVSGGCRTVDASGNCTAIQTDIQVATINADGSIGAWAGLVVKDTTSTAISLSSYGGGFIVWRDTLYSIGGCSGTMAASNCPSASTLTTNSYGIIYNDGDIAPAQNTTVLPATQTSCGLVCTQDNGRMSQAVVINNGFIYNIGGCATTGTCSTVSSSVFYATLNNDGTIGTWTQATNSLPASREATGAAVYNNIIYLVGGTTGGGAGVTNAYSTGVSSTGDTTGAWTSTTVLATATTYPYVFARANPSNSTQGYLYIMGGCTSAAGVGCTTGAGQYKTDVRRCLITNSTGALSGCAASGPTLPDGGIGIMAGAVYGDYIYLAGGANSNGAAQTTTVYYAKLDSTGTIVQATGVSSVWLATTASLTQARRRAFAYTTNGYLYVVGGHNGADLTNGPNGTTYGDAQIGKINAQTGDITSFTARLNAINPRWDFKGAAANNTLYMVGGCNTGDPPGNCTALDGATQYFTVYNNFSGSPASYNTTTVPFASSVDRIGSSATVYNGYIYVGGGCTNIGCTTFTNTVEFAPINSDGTIGTWATTSAFGGNRTFLKMIPYNGKMYAFGGQSGSAVTTALATTEISSINSSTGALGAWAAGAAFGTTATERSGLDAVIYNGVAYVTGGTNNAGTAAATISRSPISSVDGSFTGWTTTGNTSFGTARSGHGVVAYNSTMYILGGFDGANYLLDVQYAKINSDGTIGSWASTNNLPQPVRQGTAFAANGYLYVIGGRSAASTCTNNTYVASIGANSTIANGNNPTGLGSWSQTNVKYGTAAASARYGAGIAYSDGKVYILGGGCAALVTSTDRAYYSTLQAQPQIARFGYMIDADTDVFPTKTLFNGLDFGIGASWQLNYRSSTNAANAWGLNTNFGNLALGTPQAYIPKDAAGTNTNFSRYHYIELTIDASQAFGYPEDITRGPTITDLTFQFTGDTGKRLIHGKTFIGGEQQPLDTPF